MWDFISDNRQGLTLDGLPAEHFYVGQAIHVGLAAQALGQPPVDEAWKWWLENVVPGLPNGGGAVQWDFVQRLLVHYFDFWGWNSPLRPFKYIAAELAFRVPIPQTRGHFIGTFDGIAIDPAKRELWLVDHKELANSAVVWTPVGSKRIGDMRVGDTVCTPSGSSAKVIGVYPQGISPVYRVTFHGGASVLAGPKHLWLTRRSGGGGRAYQQWHCRTTEQLVHWLDKGYGCCVPLADPVQFDSGAELLLDPYLLGALIGDGGFTSETISFTSGDAEILERVQKALPTGCAIKHVSTCNYYITGKPVRRALEMLGLRFKGSHDKFVPDVYKLAGAATRLEVLRGLMDTDGGVSLQGREIFSTVSMRLAEDVMFLARSLGRKCTLHAYAASYQVTIARKRGDPIFRLERKLNRLRASRGEQGRMQAIKSIVYVGEEECTCIGIDDPEGLFITDDFVVTHNTYKQQPRLESIENNEQFIGYCWAFLQLFHMMPAGIIYDGLRKRLPEQPPILANGELSRAINTAKWTSAHFIRCCVDLGLDPHMYDDHISSMKIIERRSEQTEFFTRWRARYSPEQLNSFELRLIDQYRDMSSESLRIYPNFQWQGCYECGVRDLCHATERGEDVDLIIQERYRRGEGYATIRAQELNPTTVRRVGDLKTMMGERLRDADTARDSRQASLRNSDA